MRHVQDSTLVASAATAERLGPVVVEQGANRGIYIPASMSLEIPAFRPARRSAQTGSNSMVCEDVRP